MSAAPLARLPALPYYAVIFSPVRIARDRGYAEKADRMVALARAADGFPGVESARDAQGFGITVRYWRDETAIQTWRKHSEHRVAHSGGHDTGYDHFDVRMQRGSVSMILPWRHQPHRLPFANDYHCRGFSQAK